MMKNKIYLVADFISLYTLRLCEIWKGFESNLNKSKDKETKARVQLQ